MWVTAFLKTAGPKFQVDHCSDQRGESHHILAVCQELHLDFHRQGESQEEAPSHLKDRQIGRRTYAYQDILTPVRLQKSGTRRDFSEAPANFFHIIGMNFYVFKMSTEIKKSCFPLKFLSKAVVSAYSKSCAVADHGFLVLFHGRQLRKAPLGKFKCMVLQMYVCV